MAKVSLTGSQRDAVPGARIVGVANPDERLEISIIVRRRAAAAPRNRAGGHRHGCRISCASRDYEATIGWDASTGVGSLNGTVLASVLTS